MSVDFVCLREAVRTLGIHWKRSRIKIRSLRSKTVDDDQSEAVWRSLFFTRCSDVSLLLKLPESEGDGGEEADKLTSRSGARSAVHWQPLCRDPPI